MDPPFSLCAGDLKFGQRGKKARCRERESEIVFGEGKSEAYDVDGEMTWQYGNGPIEFGGLSACDQTRSCCVVRRISWEVWRTRLMVNG